MARRGVMPKPDVATVNTLCGLVAASHVRVLAVVGLAKNAGKTTVVNALLENCVYRFGLTSLGLDGERTDYLTGLAKPSITPPADTLVATTVGSLERSPYAMGILERLPFRTPLGPVVIGRAAGGGHVEVSGPTTLKELRKTIARLRAHGAERVIVDGAIDRLGSASPHVSDGIVLATGGMVDDSLEDVVTTTAATVVLLSTPQVAEQTRELMAPHRERGARLVSFDARGRATDLEMGTTEGAGAAAARKVVRSAAVALFVGGALTLGFLEDLVRVLPPGARLDVVVRDATVLVLPARSLERVRRGGVSIKVLEPLRLLAVTVNPFRLPRPFPSSSFFAAIADAVGDRYPVVDVVNGHTSLPSMRCGGRHDPSLPEEADAVKERG